MLTTYLFRYTSECTISFRSQIFENFLRLGPQGGIDPLTKIPADVPASVFGLIQTAADVWNIRMTTQLHFPPAVLRSAIRRCLLLRCKKNTKH